MGKACSIIAGFLILCLTGFGCKQEATGSAGSEFWLAILTHDSVLVPLASYKDGKWSNPWPIEVELPPEPKSLDEIPPSWVGQTPLTKTWSVSLLDSSHAKLRILKLIRYGVLEVYWALATNYPTQKPLSTESPRLGTKAIGLAFTTDQKVERFRQINDQSEDWSALRSFVKPLFDEEETRQVLEDIDVGLKVREGKLYHTGHPIDSIARQARNVVLTSEVYQSRSEVGGRWFYYVEATKEYPELQVPREDVEPTCHSFSKFHAVVVKEKDRKYKLASGEGYITDSCYKLDKGEERIVPLGLLMVGGRIFVVESEDGNEYQLYRVSEHDGTRLEKRVEITTH